METKKRLIETVDDDKTHIVSNEIIKKRKIDCISPLQQIMAKCSIDISLTEELMEMDVSGKDYFGINKIEIKHLELAKQNYMKQEHNNINKLFIKSKKLKNNKSNLIKDENKKNDTDIKLDKVLVGLVISKKTSYKSSSTNEDEQINYQSVVISDLKDKNLTVIFQKDLTNKKMAPGLLMGFKNPDIIKSKPVKKHLEKYLEIFF